MEHLTEDAPVYGSSRSNIVKSITAVFRKQCEIDTPVYFGNHHRWHSDPIDAWLLGVHGNIRQAFAKHRIEYRHQTSEFLPQLEQVCSDIPNAAVAGTEWVGTSGSIIDGRGR